MTLNMFNLLIISSVLILAVTCQRERLLAALKSTSIQSILPDNNNDTTRINIGLSLINILDFDYDRQEIELRVWLELRWTEKRMQWDKKEYGGIDSVRLSTDFLPTPDLKLYNGDMKIEDDVLIVVNSDGSIYYIPPVHITAQCPQKRQHPDQITCHLKFGSWTYNCHQLQLKSDQKAADVSEFQKGWRWNLINTTTKVESMHYECCPEPYCNLKFTLKVADKGRSRGWF
ncbi:hypothetical protein LOTGIDRAFT_223269 [Lottia gigantea]|uniref:Neurotransmitter-gated ion-channel ligand-binding domain-containing protein n=1 Tax=Lottia gigantea TaxID=225164 RepID=V3YWI2_LOTGI|nr:hypothetical protein LOTGIDRAFT_223269 [Lottia gigantea]ESO82368.1 hypothetical protein LOTGIDRAFT_223269 [Lottia gigantea]